MVVLRSSGNNASHARFKDPNYRLRNDGKSLCSEKADNYTRVSDHTRSGLDLAPSDNSIMAWSSFFICHVGLLHTTYLTDDKKNSKWSTAT